VPITPCAVDPRPESGAADDSRRTRDLRILFSHRISSRDSRIGSVSALITALLQEGHEVRLIGPGLAATRRVLPGVLSELADIARNLPGYLRLIAACRGYSPDLLYERY
jgi:hypothetical protein